MQDTAYKENPLERENKEERIQVSMVKSFNETYDEIKKKCKNIDLVRIPVAEDNAPKEASIDILVDSLKQEPASTQCVFSCQAGMGRTTLGRRLILITVNQSIILCVSGMIIACQVKEIQICSELRKMAELGIGITKDTAEDLIKQKFEFPLPKSTEDDDQLLRGEFDVIKELLAKLPGAVEAKSKVNQRKTFKLLLSVNFTD